MNAKILRLDDNFAVMKLPDQTITLFPRKLLDSTFMEGETLEIEFKRCGYIDRDESNATK